MRGDLVAGLPCRNPAGCTAGFHYSLRLHDERTPSATRSDDRRMIAPSARMMLLYTGGRSEKDDFR
jgi:hypothetical protein